MPPASGANQGRLGIWCWGCGGWGQRGIGRFGCHESRKSQSLQTDLMVLLRLAVKGPWCGTVQWELQPAAPQQGSVILYTSAAAHYYYLVCLWLSFIPSLPPALWKANNYTTLRALYKHRALVNESYLFVLKFLSYSYSYLSAIWYKNCLLSWNTKCSFTTGVVLSLDLKSHNKTLILKQHQSAADVL